MKYKLSTIFQFGKHKGETVQEVLREDPSYLVWVDENIDDADIDDDVLENAITKAKLQHKDWLLDNYDLSDIPDNLCDQDDD